MPCWSSATGKTKPRSSGFRAAAKEGFDDIAGGDFVSLRSGKEIDDFNDRLEVEASAIPRPGGRVPERRPVALPSGLLVRRSATSKPS